LGIQPAKNWKQLNHQNLFNIAMENHHF
jgi:hypothetical protein